jgi:Zn-finger nucleic acid-binding protein
METERLEIVHLELKYCERCGGLWLRRRGEAHVYCNACSLQRSEGASSNDESRASYACLKRGLASDRPIVDFLVVCPQEGEA